MLRRSQLLAVAFTTAFFAACGSSSGSGSGSTPPSSPSSSPDVPTAPVTNNPGATVAFGGTHVDGQRLPFDESAPCSTDVPPFTTRDAYVLAASDPSDATGAAIALHFHASHAIGSPYPLYPEPTVGGTIATLEPAQNADPDEVAHFMTAGLPDASAVQSVTVTILAIPKSEGDRVAARLALRFADGKDLDVTLSAPVVTNLPPNDCNVDAGR